MNSQDELLKAESICVIRTDRIGDMILTLPKCNILKTSFPDKNVTLIANSYTAPLLKNCSAIDEVLYIDRFNGGIEEVLRNNRFDVAFFPRPKFDEAFAAAKRRIKLRCGSGYRWYSVLFNHRVYEHRSDGLLHEAEYNVHLISSITGEDYDIQLVKPYVDSDAMKTVMEILEQNDFDNSENFIVIHPGSGGSTLTWSAANYGIAARKITENYGIKIIITGIASEEEICAIVERLYPESLNLCGRLNLEEMIALLSRSSLFIGNSTGALHIAAALEIPVIGLYPNSPHLSARRWGPYSKSSLTISPPYMNDRRKKDDMSMISVDSVIEAAGKLLNIKREI